MKNNKEVLKSEIRLKSENFLKVVSPDGERATMVKQKNEAMKVALSIK